MKYPFFLVLSAMAFVAAGFVYPPDSVADKQIPAAHPTPPQSGLKGETPAQKNMPEPTGSITLDIALTAAITRHPSLAAAWHEIAARQGAAIQAGIRPNPTLFGEIEEFSGTGDFSGTSVMASRIGISQEFPMGGKISKRLRAAEAAVRIAKLEQQAQILEIRARVEDRFFEVFTLQERVRLLSEQADLIRKTHEVVGKRVKSGDTSPLDLTRSQIELASAKIELQQTRMALLSARHLLADSWGAAEPVFADVSAQYTSAPRMTAEELLQALQRSPAWLLLDAQFAMATASLELAEALRSQDIEVEAGVQRFNESDDHAFFLGVSVPLPLFDQNQGGIAEARALKLKAQQEKQAGVLALNTELRQAWHALSTTRQAVQSLEEEVLPAARNAYESISKAYMAGAVDILGLLEAQRIWVEARKSRLDLLRELERSRIEIKRLVGEGAAAAASLPAKENRNS